MHLFGMTGGIASGKSTVGARLRSRRVPVIDADEVAREVVAPGTEGLRALAAVFGGEVLGPEGALDRKALGRVAFADPAARRRLNAIVHPLIARRTGERTAELAGAGEPMACYEAALLVENGMADALRPLVVVACPEDVQLERLRARDGLSEADARARIRAQKPLAEKVGAADFVIDTTGPVEATLHRADDVLHALCVHFKIDIWRYPLPLP